ncbi:MAG TPA: LuxR C-terminal-related transcriptional regulator [Ktedonobacteraceae bacterium]|nr:LuxR C-terminal-related transcriptional regulator [Ktedonobacteraceae bacterium]
MPKAAPYRLRWDLLQGTYTFHDTRSQRVLSVAPDSHAWFDWLARIPSFTFSGQHGQLTIRQEIRSGGTYWYAYRRVGGKMAKRYLGRTTELTSARLEEVAAQLAEAALRIGSAALTPEASLVAPLPGPLAAPEASSPLPHGLLDRRLASKLHLPHLRPRLVHRTHLIERLQQGMEVPLTLLSAPAGCGKTTLLAQWLSQSGREAAWLSLEPEDNEPMRFLSSVIAALQTLDPHLGSSALAMLHSTPPAPLPPPEVVFAQLAADLRERAHRDLILVLDDYHVITTAALQDAVAALLAYAPPHLHLVIATRVDPALPLARLRARGQLYEVRAAHLQFSAEEAHTFLQTVMGLDLSAEERAVLQERTEGWIAGLQLAALSLQGRSDVQHFLADFTGSHRHIVDYLVEEVLARQPEAVQAFLLHTAILDRLTGPLCDAVTGGTNSDVLLEQLERANLFLVPLDERRQWYRYHHLFAEVLRVRVPREVGIAGLAALYTRASAWYEQNGMQAEAVEAALSARDFERAARLIDEPLATSMIMSLQVATLIRWLECFPHEQLFTNAFLCLVYAMSLFGSETPPTYEGPLAVAERLFQAEENHKGLGQAYMLRAIAASVRGEGVQAIKYGAQVFQLSPEDALLERSTATSALAEGYRLNGEVGAARRVLAEARLLREQAGNIPSILGDTIALGDLLIMQGKLREATDVYAPVLEAAGEWQYFAIQALIGLGNIARERNELDTAEEDLRQAIAIARKTRDKVLLARASLVRARVIQAREDAKRTRETWASTLMLAQECGYTGLVEQAQAYQVHGWLQQGRMDEVIRWQQACPIAADAPASYPQEVLALTLVRVLMAQGETGEALRLLERWRRHARTQERTGSEIEMLVLSALAYQTQGKAEQAVQLLQQALLLASPEGYVRVFVDEGLPIAVLLHMVLSRWKGKSGADEVHRLLVVLEAEPGADESLTPVASHREPPREPLTDRERKVLRLLSAGLSNAEIAAELVVSINTIRTQARSIYHKLNVKNRHEAVALARHWRLL